MRKNSSSKLGMPPGTMVYSGRETNEKVKITLIEYNETEFFEQEFFDLSECLKHLKPNLTKWINIDGVHQTELVESLGKHFDIHPLTLEDIVHIDQRPKFEEYEHYVLSILKMVGYEEEFHAEQLSLLLLDKTVISFQEPQGGDAFDIIRNRLRQAKGRVRKHGADYLFYALMDAVVDCYFHVVEKIGTDVEEIELEIINNSHKNSLVKLYEQKRELIYLRKQIWPMRDLVNNMIRSENKLLTASTQIYTRDLLDHSTRIIDTVETYRDLLSGIMDVYLSNASNKMNEVMKLLTIISSIFIPVTFIVGVYGMNFENMPELKTQNGYFAVMGIMFLIIVAQIFYFRKRKWL